MDLLGLIGFLFGYFGVPIMLLAGMVSVTVSFGFVIGSIFAAGFSLYILILLRLMGEPVKCGVCVVIKAFIILSLLNIILAGFAEGLFDEYDGFAIFISSIIPSLIFVLSILVLGFLLFHLPHNKIPRPLRIIYLPFGMFIRFYRSIFVKVKSFDQAYSLLTKSYNYANRKYPPKKYAVKKYISMSKKLVLNSRFSKSLAYGMAFYTSSLLVKGLDVSDYKVSKMLFYNYIDNLHPNCGGCGFRTNIIGNSLSLALILDDENIANIVFNQLLGKDFKIEDIHQEKLLFNLACYYSLQGEKEKMLETIHFTKKHGYEKNKFLEDKDFKRYWDDTDFLDAIEEKI